MYLSLDVLKLKGFLEVTTLATWLKNIAVVKVVRYEWMAVVKVASSSRSRWDGIPENMACRKRRSFAV